MFLKKKKMNEKKKERKKFTKLLSYLLQTGISFPHYCYEKKKQELRNKKKNI